MGFSHDKKPNNSKRNTMRKRNYMGTRKLTVVWLVSTLLLTACSSTSAIRTITFRGQAYVPINNIVPYYGMELSQPGSKRLQLQNKWHTLEFETNSRRCWVNGTLIWLNSPVRKIGWQWALKEPDFEKTIEPSVRPYAFLKRAGRRVVVLDPGHGGRDKGAVSPRKIYEKLLTRNIANRVRKLLEARTIKVYLTREDDRFLTLSERCKIAARRKADVFVSLHADSAGATAEGAGTFILSLPNHYSTHSYGSGTPSEKSHPGNRFDIANQALGTRIQQNLIKSTGQNDRGVKRARFQVLREAPCPAALVEMAFITNPKEERFVLTKSGQDKIARGIADGIAAYLYDVKRAH
jgi:N-acetylmuramoyl-L-alanine amidase